MIKISGKQRFGAVWENGKCIAVFRNGIATTNDAAVADIMRAKGYTVEGEPDQVAPEGDSTGEPETTVEGKPEKAKGSRRKQEQ